MNTLLRHRSLAWFAVLALGSTPICRAADASDLAGDWFSDERDIFVRIASDSSIAIRTLGPGGSPEEKAAFKERDQNNLAWEAGAFTLRGRLDQGVARFLRTDKTSGAFDSFSCRRLDRERDRAIYNRVESHAQPEVAAPKASPSKAPPQQPAAPKTFRSMPVFDISKLDQQPVPRFQARPQYPFKMRRAGIAGEVVVDFIVDTNGDVQNAYAIRSSQREFEAAAVQAVSKWKFKAGRKGGRNVNTHMQVPIVFTLNQE